MDVPHCQAAKDVLADAAAWPACQAPGLQAARERGTEWKRKENERGEKDRRSRDMGRRHCGRMEYQVCQKRQERHSDAAITLFLLFCSIALI